jgi:putative membrane protein insertion efficiency factor
MRISLLLAIRFYQKAISPFMPGYCRYEPTCSEYCHQAIALHGLGKGILLTIKRLLRCTPAGGVGFDPVP